MNVDQLSLQPPAFHPWDVEEVMTNYDLSISPDAEAYLDAGNVGAHPALDHFGYVWKADGRYYEQVMRFHQVVDVQYANTLQELMDAVNAKWGAA